MVQDRSPSPGLLQRPGKQILDANFRRSREPLSQSLTRQVDHRPAERVGEANPPFWRSATHEIELHTLRLGICALSCRPARRPLVSAHSELAGTGRVESNQL
jgi:hypothetical protein